MWTGDDHPAVPQSRTYNPLLYSRVEWTPNHASNASRSCDDADDHPFAFLVSVAAAGVIAVAGDVAVNDLRADCRTLPSTLTADDRAVRAGRDRRRRGVAAGQRAARARPSWSRRRASMDALFLRQVWARQRRDARRISRALADRVGEPAASRRRPLHYFLINKGPWSRLDHNAPFVPGAPAKPEGANFYPGRRDQGRRRAMARVAAGEREGARHRLLHDDPPQPAGGFVAVPYSVEYQGELARAAALLREAAALTREPTLKTFLTTRADAFLIERLLRERRRLDGARRRDRADDRPVRGLRGRVVQLQGRRSRRSSPSGTRRRRRSCRRSPAQLQDIENHLPIDPKYRNPQARRAGADPRRQRGLHAPATATAACRPRPSTCPTTSASSREKGTKRVMLKNVQDAKFETRAGADLQGRAGRRRIRRTSSFDAFFTHILMHELMHGLGPHNITVAGRADDGAAGAEGDLQRDRGSEGGHLRPVGAAPARRSTSCSIRRSPKTMYTTFLASAFRSIRFGVNEAHGRGIAVQLNYLLDAGAFKVLPGGAFAVDETKIADAVTSLTREIMTLQAEGSYAKTKDLLDRLGVVRPSVQKVLDRLTNVPVDIEPTFTSAAVQ